MIDPGLRLPANPAQADRRLRLLSTHDETIQRVLGSLPPPLGTLALAHKTYFGADVELPVGNLILRSPPAIATAWLYSETFDELDDGTFLAVAEAGACIQLASVVLDHLVDGQLPDPGGSSLLYKALTDHGVTTFLKIFRAGSAFWSHYERLTRRHLDGLAAELDGRSDPRRFSYEALEVMARGKACPVVLTVAALCEASGRTELLEPIARSMELVGVASQLVDDTTDWQKDAETRHLTYFLSCLGPDEAWSPDSWPSVDTLARRLESDPLDTHHLRRAVSLLDQALELVHDISCPQWGAYIHSKRLGADRLLAMALIRALSRSLSPGNGGSARLDEAVD